MFIQMPAKGTILGHMKAGNKTVSDYLVQDS